LTGSNVEEKNSILCFFFFRKKETPENKMVQLNNFRILRKRVVGKEKLAEKMTKNSTNAVRCDEKMNQKCGKKKKKFNYLGVKGESL
jgi:hypothetical protein